MQQAASHAQHVVVNNQNTTLIEMKIDEKTFILHDNRIFVFRKADMEIAGTTDISATTSSPEQNILLNIITTPFFRIVSAIYLVFRIVDNLALLSLVILSLFNNQFTPVSTVHDKALLFCVFGFELIFDMLLLSNKYWALQRVSLFIALLLFMLYTVVLYSVYGQVSFGVVWVLLSARFGFFVLETSVDVAFDCLLHNELVSMSNELVRGTHMPMARSRTVDSTTTRSDDTRPIHGGHDLSDVGTPLLPMQPNPAVSSRLAGSSYDSANNATHRSSMQEFVQTILQTDLVLPGNIIYEGSFFAWSLASVYDWDSPPDADADDDEPNDPILNEVNLPRNAAELSVSNDEADNYMPLSETAEQTAPQCQPSVDAPSQPSRLNQLGNTPQKLQRRTRRRRLEKFPKVLMYLMMLPPAFLSLLFGVVLLCMAVAASVIPIVILFIFSGCGLRLISTASRRRFCRQLSNYYRELQRL